MSSTTRESEGDQTSFTRFEPFEAADRALANALPQVIWTCDAQGQLEWVNDRWFELTGLSEEQTLNDKGALVAVHPDDRAELVRRWGLALETGTATEIEYRIRTVHGDYRWHVGQMAPVRGPSRDITRWVAAAFDMHDRRVAEDALRVTERSFEAVFDLNPQPLAITRQSDGVFLNVNDAFVSLTGFARGETIGKSAVDLGIWRAEDRAEFLATVRSDHLRSQEIPVRTKDGRIIHVVLSNAPIEIDGEPCFVSASPDVTDRRATEDALRKSEARKDEFLAMLSHELRNPLTPILAAARLLEPRVDPMGRHDLDVIVRQVKHLVRLVDDLLDVSRVARGAVTLSMTRLEPATVVARAVEATAPLFEERGHRLEISVPAQGLAVVGDEVRLTQVLDNLFSNAARYTPPGGIVSVTGTREDDSVVLRVRDSGVGIDPALLPDLFDTFVQGARSPDRAEGGLGIGLSLVRTLTELHGGTVSAHSAGAGRGSEFAVRLPAAGSSVDTAGASVASRPTVAEPSRRVARVLFVDDQRDVVDGISRLLTIVGYDVRSARDPFEAIAVARTWRPDVAILDIGLPGMDGYALARELSSRLSDAPPILVALSGYSQASDRHKSAASGFVVHLVKPIDVDELVDVIARLVADRELTAR